MPKAMAIKALADGQLAASKATLYPTPASTQTIVRSITLVNTHSSVVKVNIYIQRDGTNSRRILPKDMELQPRFLAELDTVYTLEAADLIEGDADVANVVDFTINGVEET